MPVSPNKKKRTYPFYVSITVLAVALVVGLTAIFLWVSHKESSVAAIQTADRLFNEVNDKAVQLYQDALGAVAGFAGAAALMPGMSETPSEDGLTHPPAVPILVIPGDTDPVIPHNKFGAIVFCPNRYNKFTLVRCVFNGIL